MSQLEYHSPRPPLGFPDRSASLLTVGILLILSGLVTGCLSASIPLVVYVPQPAGRPEMPLGQLIISLGMYLGLTILLIWLGVGALLKRRWSRPLVLILATHWSIAGAAMLVMMLAMLPMLSDQFQAQGLPAGAAYVTFGVSLGIIALFMVLLPLVLVFLLRPAAVEQTCRHYDPDIRWTDRCSLPVLGAALTLGVMGALTLLAAPMAVIGFFGVLLTGPAAVVVVLVVGAALGLSAIWVYRYEVRGLWLGMIVAALMTLSLALTSLIVPAEQYMKATTNDPVQIQQAVEHGDLFQAIGVGGSLIFGAAFIIYLLQVRKHLRAAAPVLPVNAGLAGTPAAD